MPPFFGARRNALHQRRIIHRPNAVEASGALFSHKSLIVLTAGCSHGGNLIGSLRVHSRASQALPQLSLFRQLSMGGIWHL